MTYDEKCEIIKNNRILYCLFCGEGKECSECEVQKAIDKMMREE